MPAEMSVPCEPRPAWSQRFPLLVLLFAVVAVPFVGAARSTAASPDASAPDDEALRAGAEVFTAACATCHQPGGVGLPGQFPPLANNPNVDDADYLEDVIRNGLTGEIVVNGETYNTPMPPPPALSDGDVASVITYIQSGFAAPAAPAAGVDTAPVADSDSTNWTFLAAIAIAIGLGALVLSRRSFAVRDRREVTWLDAVLKAAVIVAAIVVTVVIVPAKVLELKTVQDMPRAAQDLITVGLWSVALGASLLALWWAHRERRI